MADQPPEELPPDEVERLEASIAQSPDATDARLALLGHYLRVFHRERGRSETVDRLTEHARWVIANLPGSKEAGQSAFMCQAFIGVSRQVKEELVSLWRRQVEAHPDDPDVLSNAAQAFQGQYDDRALELLRRARTLAPDRVDLTVHINAITDRLSRFGRGDGDRALSARERMRDIEDHLPVGPDGKSRTLPPQLAAQLGVACLEAGELDKAERAAHAMLHFAPSQGWNSGNLYFTGNMVLGLVSLRRGDLSAARDYLLASAETKGSPQLNSFGPNMSLAKELLARGEIETVVKFFEQCASFWDRPKLNEWIAVAKAGIVPDFGANLHY